MKPNERMKASAARMMSLTSDRFIARPSLPSAAGYHARGPVANA